MDPFDEFNDEELKEFNDMKNEGMFNDEEEEALA